MKLQISRHFVLASILTAGLILSISKVVSATENVKNFIVSTNCCKNGLATGVANDCVSGSGTCEEHFCAPGEFETVMPCDNP